MPNGIPAPVPPKTYPDKLRITLIGALINLAFFLFLLVLLTRVLHLGPSGIEYTRPTDLTALWLLPLFVVSTFFLGFGVADQYLNHRQGEAYFIPAFLMNCLQFLASLLTMLFLIDILTCFFRVFYGIQIC